MKICKLIGFLSPCGLLFLFPQLTLAIWSGDRIDLCRTYLDSKQGAEGRTLSGEDFQNFLKNSLRSDQWFVPKEQIDSWMRASRQSAEEIYFSLSVLVADRARTPISNFHVGAAGVDSDGNVILGANLEFRGSRLGETFHAERTVIALAHEKNVRLKSLYSSVTPCGGCRQWLYEIEGSEDLNVVSKDKNGNLFSVPMRELTPHGFGPWALGQTGMLNGVSRRWELKSPGSAGGLSSELVEKFLSSYAPYSGQPAAAEIQLRSGKRYSGSYIEQVAYESFPALGTALVKANMENQFRPDEVASIDILYAEGEGAVDHVMMTHALIQSLEGLPESVAIRWHPVDVVAK